jgi:LPS export ABC transporter protein LptC
MTGLQCHLCGTKFPAEALWVCDQCLGPLEVEYDYAAVRGAISRDGEDIFLYDNVVLVRSADKERPEARITTSFLQVVRDRSLVRTDKPVLIVEDHRTLAGRGMEYNNESQQLLLLSEVRGSFEPKKTP